MNGEPKPTKQPQEKKSQKKKKTKKNKKNKNINKIQKQKTGQRKQPEKLPELSGEDLLAMMNNLS